MCYINGKILDGICRIIKNMYVHYITLNYSTEKGKKSWIMVIKIRLTGGVYYPLISCKATYNKNRYTLD